ncbi:Hypothetical protein NocV09_02100940 [Nannochloropsis oceanica]
MLFTEKQLAKGTASRVDGISQEEEENYRRKTNEFVVQLCRKLDMNPMSMWNASTLTHRFFTYESFKRRDRLLVGATAVFLGGKMAENARRLLDVVGHYHALRHKTPNLPPEKSKLVQDLKEEVLAHERLMLHVIGFNLYIEIPRAKFGELGGKVKAHAPEAYEKLVPWAANVLNDLYSKTTLCLRCEAAVIAQIALYLAVRHFTLPEPKIDLTAAGGSEGGGDKVKKSPGTWREVFGLGNDAQTFCLIKRAIDVYRGNHFAAYRPLVRRIDLEIAAALALEKREDVVGGGMLTASPPPPPPPSALPSAKLDR